MARGNDTASSAATTAQDQAKTSYGNANALFGPLSANLLSEAAHPAGIDPATMSRMDTASMEAAGGANGSAAAAGALRAARTRNAGAADAAIGSAARTSGETASRGILANRVKSAELAQQNRRSALTGLEGLFGQNLTGGNQASSAVASNVNANTEAENASWDWAKDLFVPLAQAGASAAGKAYGG